VTSNQSALNTNTHILSLKLEFGKFLKKQKIQKIFVETLRRHTIYVPACIHGHTLKGAVTFDLTIEKLIFSHEEQFLS